jgi:hypothetical protein
LLQIAQTPLNSCCSTQNKSSKTPYFFTLDFSPCSTQPTSIANSLIANNFQSKNPQNQDNHFPATPFGGHCFACRAEAGRRLVTALITPAPRSRAEPSREELEKLMNLLRER